MLAWIKMRVSLADDPAVISMARRLGASAYEVVGLLHSVWSWANLHTEDGIAKGVKREWLDNKFEREGLADAMMDVGWLLEDDAGIIIPKFDRHNGHSAKARAQATERKRLSRFDRDKSVTREEKRTAEKTPKPKKPPAWVGVLAEAEFEGLRSDESFASSLDRLREYRRERGLASYKAMGYRSLFRKVNEHGIDAFASAIEETIANNHQGVFFNGATGNKKNSRGVSGEERSRSRRDDPEPGSRGPDIA